MCRAIQDIGSIIDPIGSEIINPALSAAGKAFAPGSPGSPAPTVQTQLGQTGAPINTKRRSLLSNALTFGGVDSTQAAIGNPQAKATLGA
jgi:hypothetical protein